MNVTRDVILDLLPLYLAGEASPASRTLVEEYLQTDPELARQVREHPAALTAAQPGVPPAPELEMRTLRRTHAVLAWQRWLFGIGIACLAVSLSIRIDMRGALPTGFRFLIVDAPLPLGTLFVLGVACLLVYRWLRRMPGSPS